MTTTIAVAGKGGTGKTTLSALIIRHLHRRGKVPILAVDADPAAHLAEALGMNVEKTVGTTQAEFHDSRLQLPPGMPKNVYLEMCLNQVIVEGKGLDLITMGRPEGPGCYCSSNAVLREFLDVLGKNYSYVVMDNQAGMEHLSRKTTQNVDVLLMLSDQSIRGIRTVGKLLDLIRELNLRVNRSYMVIDRTSGILAPPLEEAIAQTGIDLAGCIPVDENIIEFDQLSRPLMDLPDNSPAVDAVAELMEKLSV
ncbi:MAG: AAA family ATPase [Deltaproteobacteria bacterium]|nr:AAA family ATPase [Deltaproteobacteria bacterium]MBW2308106.1 AAA family ATPase [Deltaproteobacteria bacterium]